ncbi:hypothetical protein GCM10009775_11520 [Microbacterium aoyamense]|uniref:SnoaL-like domain-containing protein n=1 Tax=Microbacterium aoyamense TaxID=344166 RepID=A0ABP5AUP6_9MICO|nr:nuclear transport factor 2 family protein [Microbacterium aoyamense]
MIIALFRRRLREGATFESFITAWEADKGFGVPARVFNAVSLEDPREVLSVGFVDIAATDLGDAAGKVSEQEAVRHSRIDDVVEQTVLHSFYDLRTEHDFSFDPHAVELGSAASLLSSLVPPASDMEQIAERFIAAFNAGDFAGLRALLDDGLTAFVTTDDGQESQLQGGDAYVDSLRQMLTSAPVEYEISLTQRPVAIDDHQVLIMIEVRAARRGRTLHNYSSQLFTIERGVITTIRMTDAKPAESSEFWSA